MDEKEALISQLKSVQLPEVSGFPAMGWWVLLAVLVLIALLVWFASERHRAMRWQREAKQEIARIRAAVPSQSVSSTLADTSRLARRVLLLSKPREQVASLHGDQWLHALDGICDRPLFAEGFGKLLQSYQYQRDPKVSTADLNSLMDAMDELIRSAARHIK